MVNEKFIFCLEGVRDIEDTMPTHVVKCLEELAIDQGISSIHKTCDTIEGLEESLNILLYEDHNFKDYEIIYLAMPGQQNNICLHDYYYSIEEIAELFEGKMKGKIIHFANLKVLDLNDEEAQYFLEQCRAPSIRAASGRRAAGSSISIRAARIRHSHRRAFR